MRKASELRNLDTDQLQAEAVRLQQVLFELRNKAAMGRKEKTHETQMTRKERARILTILNERRTAAADTAGKQGVPK